MSLITFDPGVTKGSYWVYGAVDVFSRAGHLEHMRPYTPEFGSLAAVVETPVKNFASTDGDTIDVARAAERCVAWWTLFAPHLVTYLPPSGPGAWKVGAKVAHQQHIWDALTHAEREVLIRDVGPRGTTAAKVKTKLVERCLAKRKSDWVMGNAIDAAGLYLYSVGRIDTAGRLTGKGLQYVNK
jgi:hypothetical protein